MDIDELLAAALRAAGAQEGPQSVGGGGLSIYRVAQPSPPEHRVYQPVLSLILQGAKSISTGDRTLVFRRGQSLLIGVDLAVLARVTEATPTAPYLALSIRPDMDLLRALAVDTDAPGRAKRERPAFEAVEADSMLLSAMGRLLALASSPRAEQAIAPLTLREIHWWMLEGPHGPLLRRLLRADGVAARIARAVALIRSQPERTLRIAELADEAAMSPSAFHAHFREVTETTPLQFQKRLRLIEAQARLRAGSSVTEAAFAVGYQSPTQFSREYRRSFGVAPRAEHKALAAE